MSKLLLMFLPVIGRPAAVATKPLPPPPSPTPRVSIQVCAAKLADSIQEEAQKKQILMDSSDFVTVFAVQKFGTLTFQSFFIGTRAIVLNSYWTLVIMLEEHNSICCSTLV